MNIRTWITFIFNSLLVSAIILLSFTFYKEFSRVLNERVLLQLNSIKTLKQIQIEKLINTEWQKFNSDSITQQSIGFDIPRNTFFENGIYDVTHLHPSKQTSVVFVKNMDDEPMMALLSYEKIKNILLERTGMGSSGESYIVASDYRLRSQSRFFPEKIPYQIIAETEGVVQAFQGITQTGIFPDYRNVKVFSAYQPFKIGNIQWVILSEIDYDEVTIPLRQMRQKLIFITAVILLMAIILSLILTKIITQPIIDMKQRLLVMSKGNYRFKDSDKYSLTSFSKKPKEINEMFEALISLKTALSGAVDFSVDIGNMNLNSTYIPKSPEDLLGHTLLKMHKKLIALRNKEQQINNTNKRLLLERLEGERKKLARELHDGLGPFLTTLKFYIQNNLSDGTVRDEIKKMIDDTITEVRTMTNALMPSTLEDFGIGIAIKNYVQSIQQSVVVEIEFDDASKELDSKISNELAVNLFRIIQELINNTIKHSQANQIKLTLSEFDSFVSLYYFDNGGGFDMNKITLGSGITNIKERVASFNGKITIRTQNKNTIFEIELPL